MPSHRSLFRTRSVPAIAPTLLLAALVAPLIAQDSVTASGDETAALRAQVDALSKRMQRLEQDRATPAPTGDTGPTLTFGVYGELKFGLQQNPDADGGWQNGFDGGRVTLMPSCVLSDRLVFKAEVEFEHGGIAFDDDDKAGGSVEVEQAYIDWRVGDDLHWRLPGIDVIPFGYTNLNHEPTLFYSVQRPELANGLIPTTWFAGATSVHGQLAGAVTYEFQISSSLVDDGGNVRDTTDANGPATPTGYEAGVSGAEGFALARPTTGDFRQQTNALGYCLNLGYGIPAVEGLRGSTSFYYSDNITPRGAYASDVNGVKTGDLHRTALLMADTELRFRPAREGLELRAEAVAAGFSNPGQLRANNDGDAENNVGRSMWGASGEVAYHIGLASADWEIVPFYRYTRTVLQTTGVDGADDDQPTGSGKINYHTVGLAVFPGSPHVVIKLDYQAVRDGSADGAKSDHLLGGVGFFF